MRLRHRFLFSMDMLFEKTRNTLMVVILLTAALFATTLIAALMDKSGDELEEYKALYAGDLDCIYQVQINSAGSVFGGDGLEEFINGLAETDGVSHFGYHMDCTYGIAEVTWNEQMAAIVKAHGVDSDRFDVDKQPCRIIFTNRDMAMMIAEVSGKHLLDALFEGSPNKILVGEAFAGLFPIGSKMHFYDVELEVLGYIPVNTYWPADGYAGLVFANNVDLGYNLVISSEVMEKMYGKSAFINSLFLEFADTTSFFDVNSRIHSLSEKIGGVSLMSVGSMLSDAKTEYLRVKKMYSKLLAFMWFVTVLTAVMAAVISVMMQRRKIGIFLSQGILPEDIAGFIIAGQFIKCLFAAAMAYFLGRIFLNIAAQRYLASFETASIRYMIWLSVVCCMGMTIVPLIYLNNQKTVNLVKIRN